MKRISYMSDHLIDQYRQIHSSRQYGDTSIKNLRYVRPQVVFLAPESIIDFGCGRSQLVDVIGDACDAKTFRYDPAIPDYSEKPKGGPFDLLINVDVLEHIPEDELDAIVGEMASLCKNAIIVIDTRPAEAVLPNGENAHCTLKTHECWQNYLARFFPHVEPIRVARRSRAAFRTWKLDPTEEKRLQRSIMREKLTYGLRRLAGKR